MKQLVLTLLGWTVQVSAQIPLLLILVAIVPLCDLLIFTVNIVITSFNKISIFIAILKDAEFRNTLREFAELAQEGKSQRQLNNLVSLSAYKMAKRSPRGVLLSDREG